MDFSEKIKEVKEYIAHLQALPEHKKKIIFFTVIIISALIMLLLEIKLTQDNLAKIKESAKSITIPQLNMPEGNTLNLPNIPFNEPGDSTSTVSEGDAGILQNENPDIEPEAEDLELEP